MQELAPISEFRANEVNPYLRKIVPTSHVFSWIGVVEGGHGCRFLMPSFLSLSFSVSVSWLLKQRRISSVVGRVGREVSWLLKQ